MHDTAIELICPRDGGSLLAQGMAYHCATCSSIYPIDSGVVRLLERPDDFYEGAYQSCIRFLPRSEKPWAVWPLWLINNGHTWAVRKHVPAGSTVVELGCASGVKYFGRRYRMIGCDLSFASLRNITEYDCRIQADAAMFLPFPDESIDAIVSSFFWEHIPPDAKPAILAECFRVLRPHGKLIFLYDVETRNPLIQHYKRKSLTLYNKLFLEGDGHVGYQTPKDNRNIFAASGFEVLEQHGMEKTLLQSPACYEKLARFENSRLLNSLARLGSPPWFYAYTALLRVVDALTSFLLPASWARIDLTVARKQGATSRRP